MKLEVGMYCYNKTNRKLGIGEIISFQRNNNVNIKYKNDIELVSNGNIEASHNIIDLIEEGDYVNDYKVDRVQEVPNKEIGKVVVFDSGNVSGWEYEAEELYKHEIKSIVTKEQFESMQYKVD